MAVNGTCRGRSPECHHTLNLAEISTEARKKSETCSGRKIQAEEDTHNATTDRKIDEAEGAADIEEVERLCSSWSLFSCTDSDANMLTAQLQA